MIISTGMATYEEVKNAVRILKKNKCKKIVVMHCISSYPAKIENCNLNSIKYLSPNLSLYCLAILYGVALNHIFSLPKTTGMNIRVGIHYGQFLKIKDDIVISLDVASSEFYKDNRYILKGEKNLPLGLQIIGKQFEDLSMLKYAKIFKK